MNKIEGGRHELHWVMLSGQEAQLSIAHSDEVRRLRGKESRAGKWGGEKEEMGCSSDKGEGRSISVVERRDKKVDKESGCIYLGKRFRRL